MLIGMVPFTSKTLDERDIVKGYKVGQGYMFLEEEYFQKATLVKLNHLEFLQLIYEEKVDAAYFATLLPQT